MALRSTLERVDLSPQQICNASFDDTIFIQVQFEFPKYWRLLFVLLFSLSPHHGI